MYYLISFFKAQAYTDENQNRKNKVLHILWLSYWIFFTILFILGFFFAKNIIGIIVTYIITSSYLFVVGILKFKRHIREASIVFISMIWITIVLFSFVAGGMLNVLSSFFIVLIIIAGVLLGSRSALVVLIFSSLAAIAYILIDDYYYKIPVLFVPAEINDWLLFTIIGSLVLIPIFLDVSTLEDSLKNSNQSAERYKQLSETLDQQVKIRTSELEQSNNDLKSFTYAISHDLRSPLNLIENYSALITEKYSKDTNSEILNLFEKIKFQSNQMNMLFDELLKFFRITKQPLNKKTLDMNLMVYNALINYEDEIKKRKVSIVQNNLLPCIGDEKLLTLVWTNLLSNAIKYTRHQTQPKIEIGQLQDTSEKPYYIRDNGIGFDSSNPELFNEFIRLQNEFEGNGLGLAICKRIIENHKGKIWAESILNNGSTFYFTIESILNF